MSDPYRDAELRCISCQQPLLADGARLWCDGCGSTLAPTADLLSTIRDLWSLPTELSFTHERPDTERCPRCSTPMTRCRVDALLDTIHAHPWRTVLRCTTDGVWFPRKRYDDFLALVERKARKHYKDTLPTGGNNLFALR